MNTWFECKVRYTKAGENGSEKKVTELYLVDAMSFTEAEARIIEEMRPFIGEGFKVTAIRIMNYSEWFPSDNLKDDKWYRVKANWITLDEKSGKEKKNGWYAIVQSSGTAEAEKHFHERMKGTLADYTIESVTETQLLDVYPYVTERETDETR